MKNIFKIPLQQFGTVAVVEFFLKKINKSV